ncbi:MAG: hypothetical protein LAT84_10035 [Balneolia bacterium]|nr:hypothetical protein [Balneolia bacterium]
MKTFIIILLVSLLWIFSACDSPTRPFNNTNVNDPQSGRFVPTETENIHLHADSTGVITITWFETESAAEKIIIEKSLGDSLSYVSIAELSPDVRSFKDSSLVVQNETFYRVSAWVRPSKVDILLEKAEAKLDIGEIFDLELQLIDDQTSLELKWKSTYPFFTHFDITSNYYLNDQQEKTVRIEADGRNHSFTDHFKSIEFNDRTYTVSAVIKHDDTEEIVSEIEDVFDTASVFKPQSGRIIILNETDWIVTWEGAPFFATGVEVTREKNGEDDLVFNLPVTRTSLTDREFARQANQTQEFRRYLIRYTTGEFKSEPAQVSSAVTVSRPVINLAGSQQDTPSSFTLSWSVTPSSRALVNEFVIEQNTAEDGRSFEEIARVDGNVTELIIDNLEPDEQIEYRVRSRTSAYSNPTTFVYSNDYQPDFTLPTGMSSVTRMETSSDNRYLAAVSHEGGASNPIIIYDLVTQQQVSSINIHLRQIKDFAISPDDDFIYFTVPSQSTIYQADFPSGNNIAAIIEDASVFNNGVHGLAISSDGSFLVGVGGSIFVKRWNLNTFELVFTYNNTSAPFNPDKKPAISPDGKFIAAGGSRPLIFDAETGEIVEFLFPILSDFRDLQFSADGTYVSFVTTSSTGTDAFIYSTANWEGVHTLRDAYRIAFHPQNSDILLSGEARSLIFDAETLTITDLISDEEGFGFSPDPRHALLYIDDDTVALVDDDSSIQIWKRSNTEGWRFIR